MVAIDKPEGLTSRRVVNEVSRSLRVKKAGHLGTLDPFATGVLIVLLGKATRVAPFLQMEPKEYQATLKLGLETDTQDRTGKVVREVDEVCVSQEEVRAVLSKFKGAVVQTPPMFSALKHQGVALYKLARRGQDVPRRERLVEIFEIEVEKIDLPFISFRVLCSGGTYIRTLASDVGRGLGCGAHLTALRRLRTGGFTIKDCLTLDQFKELARAGKVERALIPINEALSHIRGVTVSRGAISRVGRGQGIGPTDLMEPLSVNPGERLRLMSEEGHLLALAEAQKDGVIKPIRVLI